MKYVRGVNIIIPFRTFMDILEKLKRADIIAIYCNETGDFDLKFPQNKKDCINKLMIELFDE